MLYTVPFVNTLFWKLDVYTSSNFSKSVSSSAVSSVLFIHPWSAPSDRLNAFNINISIWVLYSRSVGPFDHEDASDGWLDRTLLQYDNISIKLISSSTHDV